MFDSSSATQYRRFAIANRANVAVDDANSALDIISTSIIIYRWRR